MLLQFSKSLAFLFCLCAVLIRYSKAQDEDASLNEIENDEDTLTQFRNFMREARRTDGIIDPNILIQRSIRDPVPISDFNVSSSGLMRDIAGQFTSVQLHGLKGFQVQKIEVNLSQMNLSAEMFIPFLTVIGHYNLSGKISFFTVSGNGGFWMNLTKISIKGHSPFHTTTDGNLEMGEVILNSDVEDINLHFENLMGGGAWSALFNSALNQLSDLILDELKHSLLQELGSFLRTQFNDHLFKSFPVGFLDPNSTNIMDSILKHAAQMIVDKGLDPVVIPELKKNFERNLLFVTTRGELSLTNGYLYGLSSLKRKGDIKIVFANHSVSFVADFGFENLTATYDWEAKMFGVGPQGSLEVQVKSLDGFMSFQQLMRNGSGLALDNFIINDVRQIWLDIQGLGTWDYIMEIVVNLATNGLKMHLADVITGPVKGNIQKEIDTLNISMP